MGQREDKKIKCVVWDLDNTLWDGVLLENPDVILRKDVIRIIKTLDSRGILQSVASKNNFETAMAKVETLGLKDYFLYPRINWAPKSSSIRQIANSINIGIDQVAFVDDQSFELDEVAFSCPGIMCIDAGDIAQILDMPEMMPRFITDEAAIRRKMYLNDIRRDKVEQRFEGPKEEFLASLNMVLTIGPTCEDDLQRAEELTVRTHQLNTTGYTYSYDELNRFRRSNNHTLLIASLDDTYGTYGKIGLALIEKQAQIWHIKLLLMSCRVMARGIGSVMITHIRNQARNKGVSLRAAFVPTDVNRMMYMTYKFAGFEEVARENGTCILENNLEQIPPFPDYIKIIVRQG